MAVLHERFRNDLRNLFGIREDDITDIVDDAANSSDNVDTNVPTDKPPEDTTPEDTAQEDVPVDDETDDAGGVMPEPPETDQVPGTGDKVTSEGTDDNSKVSSMFRDMGKPESDYGLTNPNNIRLSKFRFTKSGIDINQMMNEIEKKVGLTADKLIYRLTPEQLESYKDKGKELRLKYELINKREKNIIMFNSRIPIYYLDKNTNKIEKIKEDNPNLLKNAYSKLDDFITKRFGEHWVDDLNAIDFIQSIKINFAETDSITPNMITTKFFEGDDNNLIPFNKLYVKTPKAVEDFVKENKENQMYLRSSIYRTLAAGYLNGSTDSNGVYTILKTTQLDENIGTKDSNSEDAISDENIPNEDPKADQDPDIEAEAIMNDITDSPDGDLETQP